MYEVFRKKPGTVEELIDVVETTCQLPSASDIAIATNNLRPKASCCFQASRIQFGTLDVKMNATMKNGILFSTI